MVGRMRMRTIGLPATGSMRRMIIGGRNTRSYCLKRGAKSVTRSAEPSAAVIRVVRIAVLRS
jgi:hypothetical protein